MKEINSEVRAELGLTRSPREKPCALMYKDDYAEYRAVVIFEVDKGKIQRFDLCIPDLFLVEKTGVLPV